MKTFILQLTLLLSTTTVGLAQISIYLDAPPSTVDVFVPGVISTGTNERDLAISPDEKEIYYTVFKNGFDGNIYYSKKEGEYWSTPSLAPFSGNDEDLEPAFAHDGNRLYFSSNRNNDNYDIWYVERTDGGAWSEPISIGAPINTAVNEFYPSIVADGSIYYTAKYDHGIGGEDIWYSQLINGVYQTPVLAPNINTEHDEFNAFVDPNETYIYFCSFGRPDGLGGGDIYISNKSNQTWQSGVNLGDKINSTSLDYCPYVSPNEKYLIFTSERAITDEQISTNPFDIKSIVDMQLKPNSSGSNLYWVEK